VKISRPHQIATAADHGRDGGEHRQGLGPDRQVRNEAGAMAAGLRRVLRRADGQQGQKGEQRDDRQILQQQHPEGGSSDRSLAQTLLIQGLENDGRGGHGQHQAHG
jgi:hypothetical protein